MNFHDAVKYLSNSSPVQFHNEIKNLSIDEIERLIRKLNGFQIFLEQMRDKKLREPIESEEIYNVKEAAIYLKVTTQTIYNLVTRGEIKSSKVGNAIRIPMSELKRYLNNQNS